MHQLHYRWFATIAFLLSIIAGLVMPIFWNWDVIIALNQSNIFLYLLVIAAGFIVFVDGLMAIQAWHYQKVDGYSSLWLPILGQSAWFVLTLWMYFSPSYVNILKTVTLPITMFGIGILFLTLSWTQKAEAQAPASTAMVKSAKRLSFVTIILALYGFLFFGLTWNLQIGLAVATASLVIIDPRWPLISAAKKRHETVQALTDERIVVQDSKALDRVKGIQQAVIEKTGVLTSRQLSVYNVDSNDDEFSEQDVLAIMAGLEQEIGGVYAEAVLTYGHNQGVYPTQATSVEVMPLIGVKGFIQGQEYLLVSATYALKNNYVFNRQWLKDLIALGNSVSVLVQNQHAIGSVSFGAPLLRALMDTDNFLVEKYLSTNIASADTKGSLTGLQASMKSLNRSEAALSPDKKFEQQVTWTAEKPSVFVTNQTLPPNLKADVMISFINNSDKIDFVINKLADIKLIWQAGKKVNKIDHGTLVLWQIVLMALIVLAAGLEFFINQATSIILLVPINAILLRGVITLGLRMVIKNNK